eukprot:602038-Amorphochlora_amoeboformis.AAC.1
MGCCLLRRVGMGCSWDVLSLRMNESRRLNIASQQPTINVSQLIVDCLKPLDPQYIYVEDL